MFPEPVLLLWAVISRYDTGLLVMAFLVRHTDLLFECWFFFAQANHPLNLYYQTV